MKNTGNVHCFVSKTLTMSQFPCVSDVLKIIPNLKTIRNVLKETEKKDKETDV